MKKNLLSGLALLLPLAITLWFFLFLIDLTTNPFMEWIQHMLSFFFYPVNVAAYPRLFTFLSRTVVLILLFLSVLVLGFLANRLFFSWLLKKMHDLLLRVPLMGAIYRACTDIILAVLSGKKKIFSRIVVAPFPSQTSRALGFVMGNAPDELQKVHSPEASDEILKTVFIPTSPHPISGYLLLTEEKRLQTLDISLEDAFKFLISCGIFTPQSKPPTPPEAL
jgi:uncharacterized membrane protein